MLTIRQTIENTLDAIELLVKWAVTWIVVLIILGSPLLILGLESDAIGAQKTSKAFLGLMMAAYGVGILMALLDLVFRARSKENIFVLMHKAWSYASDSRAAKAMSPLVAASHQFTVALSNFTKRLLSLGLRLLVGLILAVIAGFALYDFFGLLGAAPWWAIVIIFLLIFK